MLLLQEWPDSSYPPWAMGPGYIISADIARFIVDSHYSQRLKVPKLQNLSFEEKSNILLLFNFVFYVVIQARGCLNGNLGPSIQESN